MSRSDALISVVEIALRLRMSKARVWKLLRVGVIPAWRERPGGRWIIRRAEFESWVQAQEDQLALEKRSANCGSSSDLHRQSSPTESG